jgi:SEC-C motif
LKTVVEQIEALAKEPGFIYTLCLVLMRDLFIQPDEIADIDPRQHLNIQELTFLSGLLVKHLIEFTIPTEDESSRRFDRIYELFEELHGEYHKRFMEDLADAVGNPQSTETHRESYRRILGAGINVAEAIFYSASGAYDFQYVEFAADKYQNDAKWITEHIGLDVETMARIARELKDLHERKFNNRADMLLGDFSQLCKKGLSIFCFDEDDLKQFEPHAVEAFLNAFSITPGAANAKLELPGHFNELHSRPLIRLSDGRYFRPVGFNIFEAIYESPFYWMNTDRSYAATASLNRGRYAESATARLLRSVFGDKNVYLDLEVREKKGKAITDIDVLAVVGNKAVIAQVKSKRLTELSKLGDDETLVSDFGRAVQESYDQALLCRKAIITGGNKLFLNGDELRLKDTIDDAYVLCVTVDDYPAVTHQVDVYLRKELSDPYPIALSIFDLDIITFYLTDPFEFAYYLRQRTTLSDYFKADSEMVLLGRHLKQKLFKNGNADMELLDGSYGRLIDANFQVLRGSVPRTHAADKLRSRWKNDEFQKLIGQAKSVEDPKSTDVLFLLYDLAGDGADDLIKLVKLTKRKAMVDQRAHDARVLFRGVSMGVTVLAEPNSAKTLRLKLPSLAKIAKYKSKADVWLALGSIATSDNLVDAMVFAKSEWKPDPKLDQLADKLRGELRGPLGQKIGRKERCPCNSGKNFKDCHGK